MSDAEYMRRYRTQRVGYRQRDVALSKARSRALTRLANLHPDELRGLVDEECDRDGIERPRPYRRLDAS